MSIRVAAALAACAVQACTAHAPVWINGQGDLAQDTAQCQYEAEKAAVSSDTNSVIAAFEKGERRATMMRLCMRAKGWQQG